MKSTTFALASLVASLALAQPHRHQQHHHNKRDDVVWVTDIDYVTEFVGFTTTIWVTEGYVPSTSSAKAPSSSSSSSASSSSASSAVPAQFFQGQGSSSSSAPPPPPPPPAKSSSSVYVAPTPSSTFVAPTSAPAPPVVAAAPAVVAPVESSSSSPPAPVSVPETPAAAPYTPPAVTTPPVVAPPAPSAAPSSSSSGSSGGECSEGSPCNGDITHYVAGMGACGWENDGSTDKVVALPHGLMGTQSNGNPYCGKTITIKGTTTGKVTTAKVVDKCMGCDAYSIDLSDAAFQEIDDPLVGRSTAEWWFN